MTDSQYKHLGKAVELMTELASAVEDLAEPRHALILELSKVMPNKRANEIVKSVMSDCCPTLHIGNYVVDALLAMKGAAK